jgi:hypothetical protein
MIVTTKKQGRILGRSGDDRLAWVLGWFFGNHRISGAPFYCDPNRVGAFAVAPQLLAAGDEAALFQLFVTLSMYQGIRDVVVRRRQLALPMAEMKQVAVLDQVQRATKLHQCAMLLSAEVFDTRCDVGKFDGAVDCAVHPGVECHVKAASVVFNRMGDMGKLPTSAWLRLWSGGVRGVFEDVCRTERVPQRRASILVGHFSQICRVGRKLATLYVSALSTPALARGLTPWFPEIDGYDLVVIDTNVARAVDIMRPAGAPKTYQAREAWIREQACSFDLRQFDRSLPACSARLVQEALYAFGSKSNRAVAGDRCSEVPCSGCPADLCPFAGESCTPKS